LSDKCRPCKHAKFGKQEKTTFINRASPGKGLKQCYLTYAKLTLDLVKGAAAKAGNYLSLMQKKKTSEKIPPQMNEQA